MNKSENHKNNQKNDSLDDQIIDMVDKLLDEDEDVKKGTEQTPVKNQAPILCINNIPIVGTKRNSVQENMNNWHKPDSNRLGIFKMDFQPDFVAKPVKQRNSSPNMSMNFNNNNNQLNKNRNNIQYGDNKLANLNLNYVDSKNLNLNQMNSHTLNMQNPQMNMKNNFNHQIAFQQNLVNNSNMNLNIIYQNQNNFNNLRVAEHYLSSNLGNNGNIEVNAKARPKRHCDDGGRHFFYFSIN